MTTTASSGTNVPPKEDAQTIVEERIVKFNGDHVIKKYLKGKFLGKGGFAKCYEITNLENKKV
jgi:polo-like kinase 1